VLGLERVEDVAVDRDGLGRAAQLVLEHVAEPEAQLDLVDVVVGGDSPQLQHLGEGVVRAVGDVDAVQRLERLDVARVHAEHVAEGLLGARDVGELFFVDAREALPESHLLLGVRGARQAST
jgi:hypothetical protein